MSRLIRGLKRGLDSIMAPAEDPRQTYSQTCERQRDLLSRVQKALVNISAVKNRLELKEADVRSRMPHLMEQARQYLRKGREDMARLALQRYQLVCEELKQLEIQLIEIRAEEHRLNITEQQLSAQIEAFYTRLDLIAARYSAAEAQVEINEALSGVSNELAELGKAMEKAERKSEYMQARAAAFDQLVEDGIFKTPISPVESNQSKLPSDRSDKIIDEQIAELMKDLT